MNARFPEISVEQWVATYKESHRGLIDSDPEFASWLADEYTPLAGGWQY